MQQQFIRRSTRAGHALLVVLTTLLVLAIVVIIELDSAAPAGAGAVEPVESRFPMTMPVDGMVESLMGGGCPARRTHPGIDISNLETSTATEIHAAYGGAAYAVAKGDGYGLRVEIVHPFDGGYYLTRYAHLSQAFVSPDGQPVKQGDVIGMMGRTGSATGVHLHFEVRLGTAPGTDAPVDINAAFAPCRRWIVAGQPIEIDLSPLAFVPLHGCDNPDLACLGPLANPAVPSEPTDESEADPAASHAADSQGRGGRHASAARADARSVERPCMSDLVAVRGQSR